MPSNDYARRAVITGVGAVTPIGNDAPTYWRNLVAGKSGVARISHFDPSNREVQIAAEVKDFDPESVMDHRMARRMSRFIHFAIAATHEAVADAGIDFAPLTPEERDRVAVIINTGGGGLEQVTNGAETERTRGSRFVSPFAIPALSPSMAGCLVSMEYDITGPVMTQSAACATGVLSFTDALRYIQRGEIDVAIIGGVEAPLLPMAFSALGNMHALSRRNEDPERASRPFDALRDGFVFGEGGAVMVVESAEHAMARGATIQAEILGGSLTADAYHLTAPDPTGRGAAMAMTKALRDGNVAPDEVDFVVAHGTSTQLNDVTETRAIKTTFGDHAYKLPIESPKSMVGHLLGGAGAVAGLAALGAIREGVMPPTINYEVPDPECDLDYVPNTARRAKVDTAIINGFGFGGQNAVAVFRRFSPD